MATVVEREVAPAAVSRRPPLEAWPALGVAAVVGAGVVLRFVWRSDLWLDEALSVSISRLPLSEIPEALRHDGAPPLYYFLLHAWMGVFGTGDLAVRAFSGVTSVATLPLLLLAARRIIGPAAGTAALVLAASNPFAIRYAVEARMYSLVALECTVGILVLRAALEKPSWARLAALSAVTAALLLTHYWALYLLASVVAWMALRARRGPRPARRAAGRILAALACGALAFLPWLPSFLFQASHTGAPWGRLPRPGVLVSLFDEFAGGGSDAADLLAFILFGLVALALFARPIGDGRVELGLASPPQARALAGIVMATTALAVAAGLATGTPFAGRYLAIVLAPFLLLVALGVVVLPDDRSRVLVLGVASLLGLAVGVGNAGVNRTQAGEVARAISEGARPGDVVAFCPDQLGPAVNRVLARTGADGIVQVTYPRGRSPERIDWVDYAQAIRASPPAAFARRLVDQAGPAHDVWLYWGRGYRPFERRCQTLAAHLNALRPTATLVRSPKVVTRFEHGTLTRYSPS